MATSLASFLPYVLPHVPGCPDMAAKEEVLRACIEFCEKSLAWKNFPTASNVVSGTASYTISVPSGGQIAQLEEVYHNGNRLEPKTLAELQDLYADWENETGTPIYYTQTDPASVILVPEPDTSVTSGLRFHGAYKPTRSTSTVPDFLYNDYAREIGAGAVAYLLAAPGKTWTNPELSAFYMSQFGGGIGRARIRASKGFTTQNLRVRPVAF